MSVTNCNDMTLAVTVALNPNTTNQSTDTLFNFAYYRYCYLQEIRFEDIMGKGENACNQHFLLM